MALFSKQFKQKRESLFLSRKETAKLFNIHYKTILRWENGECLPSNEHLDKVLNFLRLEPYDVNNKKVNLAKTNCINDMKQYDPLACIIQFLREIYCEDIIDAYYNRQDNIGMSKREI